MLFRALLSFAAVAVATPTGSIEDYTRAVEERSGLSTQAYGNMKYYVQHAAAAYCNFDTTPGDSISCGKNACPAVQANYPTVIASMVGKWSGVGAYVAIDDVRREVVLSVRGSNNIRNFITDVLFAWQNCDFVSQCKVHTGFAKGWEEIQDQATSAIRNALRINSGYKLVVTGHSLGGAIATLGSAYLRRAGFPNDVYTFGSPRVGNDHFANWFTSQKGGQWRITHRDDPVPRLPPIFIGYRHISPEYWLEGGDSTSTSYPLSSVRLCLGIANTDCNAGTFGLNILSHLHYLGDTAACTGFPLQWKRDEISNEELEQRLNDWVRKDQAFVQNLK